MRIKLYKLLFWSKRNKIRRKAFYEAQQRIKESRKSIHVVLPEYAKNLNIPKDTFCPGCGLEVKIGSAILFVGGYAHYDCYHNLNFYEERR